ncbi:hypothetical protein ACWFR5_21305 [Streptomyces sp. NPDC055092]
MLIRFAYLAVTHAFAALRLLPMNARDKDIEILALRHQMTVLQRRLGPAKAAFRIEGPAFLSAAADATVPRDPAPTATPRPLGHRAPLTPLTPLTPRPHQATPRVDLPAPNGPDGHAPSAPSTC